MAAKRAHDALQDFQRSVRTEIGTLHDATERFVRVAAHHARSKDHIDAIGEHVLEIGKNIDELEDMLFSLRLK